MNRRRCNRGFMEPIHASEDVIRWLESFLGPRREVEVGLIDCKLVKVEPMPMPSSGFVFYRPRYGTETGPILGGAEKAPRKKRKKRGQP